MERCYSRGDEISREQAEDVARILSGISDLPLVSRARACIVLAGACDEESLAWTGEAVRLAHTIMEDEHSRLSMQQKQEIVEATVAAHEQMQQTMAAMAAEAPIPTSKLHGELFDAQPGKGERENEIATAEETRNGPTNEYSASEKAEATVDKEKE